MKKWTALQVGRWGRFPVFSAKIGTMPSTQVIIKRARPLEAGDRIEFCEVMDLCKSLRVAPQWEGGKVSKIEDNVVFIERW